MPGPIPKRDDQRRRQNKPAIPTTRAAAGKAPKWPNVKSGWHPLAKDWFRSLKISGQAEFYEPSDIATAVLVAEMLTRALNQGQRISSQLVAVLDGMMTKLLTTEGDRRRARIELERGSAPVEAPSVAIMARYREAAEARK